MSGRKGTKRTHSATKITENKSNKKVKLSISSLSFRTLSHAGVVLVTGAGDVGQLGLGSDVLEKSRPALVVLDHEVTDVCAGGMHTVCLTKDGKVITFGCNDEGALGRNTSEEDAEFTPGEVVLPDKVIQVSAGDSHTAVLLESGKVYAWGTFRDSHGNMGLTQNGNERMPHEMLPNETVIKIASGADHLVMLTNNGKVFTCGCAEQGQLGRINERATDRKSSRTGINRLLSPNPIQTKISLKLIFDNIWAGTYCTFAKVHNKNDMFVFGLNNYNQIGLAATMPHFRPTLSKELSKRLWKQVCAAQHHTILLDDEGQVYAIGRKEYGRLGLGEHCEDAVELQHVATLKDQNCVYVGCGSSTSFAVTDKGELYGWGMGTSGQLGTGQEDDCFVPTLIKSKQLQERLVHQVSSGGQHTVILAVPANNNVNNINSS